MRHSANSISDLVALADPTSDCLQATPDVVIHHCLRFPTSQTKHWYNTSSSSISCNVFLQLNSLQCCSKKGVSLWSLVCMCISLSPFGHDSRTFVLVGCMWVVVLSFLLTLLRPQTLALPVWYASLTWRGKTTDTHEFAISVHLFMGTKESAACISLSISLSGRRRFICCCSSSTTESWKVDIKDRYWASSSCRASGNSAHSKMLAQLFFIGNLLLVEDIFHARSQNSNTRFSKSAVTKIALPAGSCYPSMIIIIRWLFFFSKFVKWVGWRSCTRRLSQICLFGFL